MRCIYCHPYKIKNMLLPNQHLLKVKEKARFTTELCEIFLCAYTFKKSFLNDIKHSNVAVTTARPQA